MTGGHQLVTQPPDVGSSKTPGSFASQSCLQIFYWGFFALARLHHWAIYVAVERPYLEWMLSKWAAAPLVAAHFLRRADIGANHTWALRFQLA